MRLRGLPACAGVAMRLDRLLMLMLDLPHIGDTLKLRLRARVNLSQRMWSISSGRSVRAAC